MPITHLAAGGGGGYLIVIDNIFQNESPLFTFWICFCCSDLINLKLKITLILVIIITLFFWPVSLYWSGVTLLKSSFYLGLSFILFSSRKNCQLS